MECAPTLESVAGTEGTYGVGVTVDLVATFSEDMTVLAEGTTPVLKLQVGGDDGEAFYHGQGMPVTSWCFAIRLRREKRIAMESKSRESGEPSWWMPTAM